jgi:hypothetical protein
MLSNLARAWQNLSSTDSETPRLMSFIASNLREARAWASKNTKARPCRHLFPQKREVFRHDLAVRD